MKYTLDICRVQITDAETHELAVDITAFDADCSEIVIKMVTNALAWPDLSEVIFRGLKLIHPDQVKDMS